MASDVSTSGLAFMGDGAEELGQGRLGIVRLATYRGEAVAVKPVDASCSLSDDERQIAHLHVNRILARLADTDGKLLEIRELCANGDLFDVVVEQGGLHPEDALRMLQQASQGLAHCHGCGVAHGQLRAEQMMLGVNDELQIIGMYAEREHRPLKPHSPLDAPEFANKQAATFEEKAAADAWACGVLYLLMLLGQPPSDRDSFARVSAHGLAEFPGIAELVPEPLHILVRQLLHQQPSKRPTLAHAAQLVEAYLTGDGATDAEAQAHAVPEVATTPPAAAQQDAAEAAETDNKAARSGKKRPQEEGDNHGCIKMVRTFSEGSGEM